MNIDNLKLEKANLVSEIRKSQENTSLSTAEKLEKNERMFLRIEEIENEIRHIEKLNGYETSLKTVSEERASLSSVNSQGIETSTVKAFDKFLRGGVSRLNSEEIRALSIGTDAAGGYLVAPTDFQARLLEKVEDNTFMFQLVDLLTLNKAKELRMPTLASDPDDADWTTEVAASTEDTGLAFGTFVLNPRIVTKFEKVSNDLISDSAFDIASIVARKLGYKFAVTAEKAMLTGDGSNKPAGVFNTAGLSTGVDVTLPTGNATDITATAADTFIGVHNDIKQGYRINLSWIMNKLIFKKIALMKDSNGQYLLSPALAAKDNDTIRGVPVYQSEFAPATLSANAYVAVLGDFKHYQAAIVSPFEIRTATELFIGTNQTGYYGRMRLDGKPSNPDAFKRIKLAAS